MGMGMTKEEAIEFITQSVKSDIDMALVADAIKALEQEPFKPMVEIDLYSVIKQKYIEREVLDKIRDEIKEWYWQADKQALAEDPCVVDAMIDLFIRTIDKYKAESEEK